MGIKRIGYGDKYKSLDWAEYICDTDDDLELLPTIDTDSAVDGALLPKCSAGSRAIVIESKKVCILNTNGVWAEYIDYAASSETTVTSVNGKTGVVELDAEDVGAYVKPDSGIPASDLEAGVIPTVPDISGKLDKSQGAANAGKFMVVGSDGDITAVTMESWQGGSY